MNIRKYLLCGLVIGLGLIGCDNNNIEKYKIEDTEIVYCPGKSIHIRWDDNRAVNYVDNPDVWEVIYLKDVENLGYNSSMIKDLNNISEQIIEE